MNKKDMKKRRSLPQSMAAFTVLGVMAVSFLGGYLTGSLRASGADGADSGEPMQYDPEQVRRLTERNEAEQEADVNFTPQQEASGAQWNVMLVNQWNRIAEDYEVSLVEVEGGEYVDERIYDPLMEMLEDAKEANLNQLPTVVSGYRTSEKQQELYDDKMEEYIRQGYSEADAYEMAGQWVAVPGCSEHQLGLAVDINGAAYDVYLWLQENSYKYGFIFRYPGEKTQITGIAEEIWHYRYVGVEAATEIYEQGICLEEYLEHMGG